MSKILDDLISAGVASDTLIAVAELIAKDRIITERRATDAARQQRHRQRNATSRDVTDCHVTARDPPEHILPPKEESSKPKRVSRSAGKCALPADWQPSEAGVAFARAKGWDDRKIADETERFRNHALAGNRKQVDWDAAWRNWVTSPYQTKGAVNGHAGTGNAAARKDRWAAAVDQLARHGEELELEERIRQGGEPAVPLLPRHGSG